VSITKRRLIAGLIVVLVATIFTGLSGCGGGGGGTSTSGGSGNVVGRVLNVETGGPLSPVATVQVGKNTSTTSPADGSFIVAAPTGATSLLVDTGALFGVVPFTIPPVSGTTDAGDLWVGPQMVTLTGRVVSSVDNQPIANATVSFAGRTGTTNAQGVFSIPKVAYSSTTQTAFWGIEGSAIATGFFNSTFSAAPSVANNSVVTVADIPLTPLSDTTPPDVPANILGRVTPTAQASGTIVTLKDHLGNPVRIFNVGSDGDYAFWVPPDNYTLTYGNGALTAADQSVSLTSTNQVVHVPDVALHG
jgi:hypothetical protein